MAAARDATPSCRTLLVGEGGGRPAERWDGPKRALSRHPIKQAGQRAGRVEEERSAGGLGFWPVAHDETTWVFVYGPRRRRVAWPTHMAGSPYFLQFKLFLKHIFTFGLLRKLYRFLDPESRHHDP